MAILILILEFIAGLFVIGIVVGVIGFISFIIYENNFDFYDTKAGMKAKEKRKQRMGYDCPMSDNEARDLGQFVTKICISAVVILTSVNVAVYSQTVSYKTLVHQMRIETGLEQYHLTVTNKDGEVIFQRSGLFDYEKVLNQIIVTDLITKEIEIITIEDDMSLKIEVND